MADLATTARKGQWGVTIDLAAVDQAITLPAITIDAVQAKVLLIRRKVEVECPIRGRPKGDMSPAENVAWSLCDDLLGPVAEATE